jgi:glycosyltransferase involved in cell wall biosynthesis
LRPKLLILGEALQPSGYARVLSGILPGLADRFEVDVFAVSYRGPVIRGRWNVHPNRSDSDEFGVYQLGELLQRLRPDILLIVFDYELYVYNRVTIEAYGEGLRTVLYCPVDGDRPHSVWVKDLKGVDRLVLYTEGARRTIEEALGQECPPTSLMPHGVDCEGFRPLLGATGEGLRDSRADARRRLYPGRPELWDGFFVLNANRNNTRKRIDLTLEAFAMFARGKPENVRLHLHMRREECCNIPEMARQLGIESRVLLTRDSAEEPDVDDEVLNLIYNSCDVGINTSTGEGWGLCAFEHAATGAAQVVPEHSACAELWKDAAIVIPARERVRYPMALCEHQVIEAQDACAALEYLYSDRQILNAWSRRSYNRATALEYRWSVIGEQWDQLLEGVLKQDRKRVTTCQ